MRTDHLHPSTAIRVKASRKTGKCGDKAAKLLHRNIDPEQWPIGHRGLGAAFPSRYKAI
jgi:hypothetical protein